MKKLLLLSALALSAMSMMAQDNTVSITFGGDDGTLKKGTSSAPYPPMNWYYYNWDNQMIYTAAQLEAAGMSANDVIKSLTFYGANTAAQAGKVHGAYTVYMTECEETRYNSLNPIAMDANTQVCHVNDYALPQAGSATEAEPLVGLNLDTPYTYQGGNLLIKMQYRTQNSYDAGTYVYGYTEYNDQVIMRGKDSLTDLEGAQWNNGTILPKLTFTCISVLDGVKDLTVDTPAVRVMNNAISVDAESAISVVAVNGMNVASVNGTSLDTTALPAGIYIVTVRNENGVSTQRFVKK